MPNYNRSMDKQEVSVRLKLVAVWHCICSWICSEHEIGFILDPTAWLFRDINDDDTMIEDSYFLFFLDACGPFLRYRAQGGAEIFGSPDKPGLVLHTACTPAMCS